MKTSHKILLIVLAVGFVLFTWQSESKDQPERSTLQEVLSAVDGVGEVYIYMEQQENNTSFFPSFNETGGKGVLIVCEGANSEATKRMIVDAVSAVLEIPPHQIKVLPLVKEEQ